jgi:CubicO group peptidase (beta-lactamase class C family)
VAALVDVPHLSHPGGTFGYSNASTTVAGRVTEVLTGLAWEDALQERLLKPAGLDSTMSLFEDLIYRRVSVGYRPTEDGLTLQRPWHLARSLAPAGSTLCSTAADLIRFARIMLRQGKAEGGAQILSAEAVRTMSTRHIETSTKLLAQAWCVGCYRKQWGEAVLFGHSGTNASGSSMLLWDPVRNMAIVSIANVPPLGYPFAYAVFTEILAAAAGLEPPTQPKPALDGAIDYDRYVGRYAAYTVTYEVEPADDGLKLTIQPKQEVGTQYQPVSSLLRRLADDRFIPEDVTVSGGRGWDVAFLGDDGHGRASHFINGVMLSRRVPDSR